MTGRVPRSRWPGIPPDTVAMLRRMRDTDDSRLNATLRRAEERGWRQTELAAALEISRQSLYKRINRPGRTEAVLIPDPAPPAGSAPPQLTAEAVAELRRLVEAAAPRGGRRAAEAAPAVAATRRLGELLDGYVRAGHKPGALAAAVGVGSGAIRMRLHRWRQDQEAREEATA